jgi:hypothetical protein
MMIPCVVDENCILPNCGPFRDFQHTRPPGFCILDYVAAYVEKIRHLPVTGALKLHQMPGFVYLPRATTVPHPMHCRKSISSQLLKMESVESLHFGQIPLFAFASASLSMIAALIDSALKNDLELVSIFALLGYLPNP